MPGILPRFRRCFVMSFLPGGSLEPLFDADGGSESNDVVSQRFRNAAVTMAQLHRIPPRSLGLESEPELGPVAEVERWCRTLETVDPALVPGWHDVRDALRASVPSAVASSIVHGDFRLGNLFAVDDRVTAVIDWEISSVGDPRVDVGWFLIKGDPLTYGRVTRYTGLTPSLAELVFDLSRARGARSATSSGSRRWRASKPPPSWSLIVKHNRRRTTPDAYLEAMASVLPAPVSRARHARLCTRNAGELVGELGLRGFA